MILSQLHTDWHHITCFGAFAEFAASLRKNAHVHITGYLCSREVEKPFNGKSKKSSATVKILAWEVRAIRIATLDRAVEVNPSTDIPADDPAF
ncbi:MAG: single-stranded DNA-binding protein [Acidobacteriota bacterium]|nr:single-stranded DNA-binding protein [Acidobacteriota bacterium]